MPRYFNALTMKIAPSIVPTILLMYVSLSLRASFTTYRTQINARRASTTGWRVLNDYHVTSVKFLVTKICHTEAAKFTWSATYR
jgi:hypothetical protein